MGNVGKMWSMWAMWSKMWSMWAIVPKFLLGGGAAQFPLTALKDPTWTMDGVGKADKKRLLQNYSKCHGVFARLN